MPPRSLQDHVQSLISRQVVEQKIVGTAASDVEARAVLESIALNLLLKPRSILYLAHLARNALTNIVNQELAAIDALSNTISDTANATFIPSSTLHLEKARTALLQMENLEKIDTSSGDFQRFNNSIGDFLEKTLSKSVRKKGSTDLVRPDTEAAVDLGTDFSALVELHTELNERLYALSVGVENFSSSPLGTILGLSTAYRARLDIEDVIDVINNGESGSQTRDIAIRVIGDRAALKSVGALPSINALLLDTVQSLPAGYVLKAVSDPAAASATGVAGPFVFATSATAAVTVNGNVVSKTHFPQSAIHLDNRAFLVSDPGIVFPVTVASGKYLFLHLRRATTAVGFTLQSDGSYLKQVRIPFTAGPRTLAQVITDLNATLGADATAAEYLEAGTGRIIIIGDANLITMHVVTMVTEPSSSTLGDLNIYDQSAHDIIGFPMFQVGTAGSTPMGIIIDALTRYFPAVTAKANDDGAVSLSTVATTPGTSLVLALPVALGMNGTFLAVSNLIKLYGTVNGKDVDPVDPGPLMDVGDSFVGPTGTSVVQGLLATRIVLQAALPTFLGNVTVASALVIEVTAMDRAVQSFLSVWLGTSYAKDLTVLDRAVAALGGKVTPATRKAAQDILSDLKNNILALAATLSVGPVPSNIGTDERSLVTGVINTLTERRYDRALSLLLKLQVQEFFEMTGDSASFGGNLLKSMSDIATTDIKFPNIQLDEDNGLKGVVKEFEA